MLEFEILKILPFDATRKMMSVVVRHPITKQIILYVKGADSSILGNLAHTDNPDQREIVYRTQQHLNAYARQGLRVLVMGKRQLSDAEFARWLLIYKEAEMAQESREMRILESFALLETGLTLLGMLIYCLNYEFKIKKFRRNGD